MAGDRKDFLLMMVAGITLDPTTKLPIVMLKDPDNKLNLPIWVGPLEATSMATELEGVKPQRPMTHDLLRNVLSEFGTTVECVEVTDLRENTYFAQIQLKTREGRAHDRFPSQRSLALALRTKSPIYVAKKVLEASSELENDRGAATRAKRAEPRQRVAATSGPKSSSGCRPRTSNTKCSAASRPASESLVGAPGRHALMATTRTYLQNQSQGTQATRRVPDFRIQCAGIPRP